MKFVAADCVVTWRKESQPYWGVLQVENGQLLRACSFTKDFDPPVTGSQIVSSKMVKYRARANDSGVKWPN